MRWRGGRRSNNVEDRRGSNAGGSLGGGRGAGALLPLVLRLVGRKGGIWTILIMVAVLYFAGADLGGLLGGITGTQSGLAPGQQPQIDGPVQQSAAEQQLAEFVAVVLGDTEDTWQALFKQRGERYVEPKLVLFRGATRSACGLGQAAMGPFYCPADQKVYLDLGFFEELHRRFQAPGDFAQAYVIAQPGAASASTA